MSGIDNLNKECRSLSPDDGPQSFESQNLSAVKAGSIAALRLRHDFTEELISLHVSSSFKVQKVNVADYWQKAYVAGVRNFINDDVLGPDQLSKNYLFTAKGVAEKSEINYSAIDTVAKHLNEEVLVGTSIRLPYINE